MAIAIGNEIKLKIPNMKFSELNHHTFVFKKSDPVIYHSTAVNLNCKTTDGASQVYTDLSQMEKVFMRYNTIRLRLQATRSDVSTEQCQGFQTVSCLIGC